MQALKLAARTFFGICVIYCFKIGKEQMEFLLGNFHFMCLINKLDLCPASWRTIGILVNMLQASKVALRSVV